MARATESYLIETAYGLLLDLPVGSQRRNRLQPALAALRDNIAAATNRSPQEVQDAYEHIAAVKRK